MTSWNSTLISDYLRVNHLSIRLRSDLSTTSFTRITSDSADENVSGAPLIVKSTLMSVAVVLVVIGRAVTLTFDAFFAGAFFFAGALFFAGSLLSDFFATAFFAGAFLAVFFLTGFFFALVM